LADAGLPSEVRQLIARQVTTMEQVEVVLLLARSEGRALGLDEIRTTLRLPPTALPEKTFLALEEAGLIQRDAGPSPTWRYAPATVLLRRAAELLAVAYNERPVTLVRALYDRPSPVQSFADAFRIRKEDDQ
jgi:hypothetical protein